MKLEICEKCDNFVQHYIYSKKFGLTKTSCGHCLKKQMKKRECLLFKESEKKYKKEISIFNEIAKYKTMFNTIIFKIKALNTLLENIEKQVKCINKKK